MSLISYKVPIQFQINVNNSDEILKQPTFYSINLYQTIRCFYFSKLKTDSTVDFFTDKKAIEMHSVLTDNEPEPR